MEVFKRLFKRQQLSELPSPVAEKVDRAKTKMKSIPAYVQATPEDYVLVSLIVAAIATEDRHESKFRITKIETRNSEALFISLIAASLAAETYPNSQFIVRKIVKK